MNTTTPRFHIPSNPTDLSFGDMAEGEPLVQHLTIAGFLSLVPYAWQVNDAIQFGKLLNNAADGLGCAYMSTTDPSLGVVRLFPVPLMKRVYARMRHQCQWPPLPGTLGTGQPCPTEDRLAEHLQALAAVADPDVQAHIAAVRGYLDQQRRRV